MRLKLTAVFFIVLAIAFSAHAQKVKVGYDKSADFSKYHTYSWLDNNAENHTIRRAAIKGEVEYALKQRGLEVVDEGGDLLLIATGSIGGETGGQQPDVIIPVPGGFYYPMSTVWIGAPATPGSYIISGTLVLDLFDRSTKSLVWQGAVSEKMDTDSRGRNPDRVRKAIAKLAERYPPKK